jgi:2-keto-4-pentenoate hydratase/2-oxohepta-3-ene-1,7-dioic acid hydratase in catechol pathway
MPAWWALCVSGRPLTMAEAEDRIFGLVLMNDWSAR